MTTEHMTIGRDSGKRVREALAPFAWDEVSVSALDRGREVFAEYVRLLTAAEDAIDDEGDMAPAMIFADYCEQHGFGGEHLVALRRAFADLLVNPHLYGL